MPKGSRCLKLSYLYLNSIESQTPPNYFYQSWARRKKLFYKRLPNSSMVDFKSEINRKHIAHNINDFGAPNLWAHLHWIYLSVRTFEKPKRWSIILILFWCTARIYLFYVYSFPVPTCIFYSSNGIETIVLVPDLFKYVCIIMYCFYLVCDSWVLILRLLCVNKNATTTTVIMNGLVSSGNNLQAISWENVNPDLCRHMALSIFVIIIWVRQWLNCHLFGHKPITEPMMTYCQLDPWEIT